MLHKGTFDRQKQQRSEVVYLKNVNSVFFDLSSGLLFHATLPASLFLDSCVHYWTTLSLYHTSNRRITSPTYKQQWIRKNMEVIVVCSWMDWRIPRYPPFKTARFLFEIWTRKLPSQGQWSLLDRGVRYTTCKPCHETQCEEVARHRHQLHATDFFAIMYDLGGNYKRLCQQWRGM